MRGLVLSFAASAALFVAGLAAPVVVDAQTSAQQGSCVEGEIYVPGMMTGGGAQMPGHCQIPKPVKGKCPTGFVYVPGMMTGGGAQLPGQCESASVVSAKTAKCPAGEVYRAGTMTGNGAQMPNSGMCVKPPASSMSSSSTH
jgi:hypothetical protein